MIRTAEDFRIPRALSDKENSDSWCRRETGVIVGVISPVDVLEKLK